jgi:L,D-transpeptidase ErfK/SrfK
VVGVGLEGWFGRLAGRRGLRLQSSVACVLGLASLAGCAAFLHPPPYDEEVFATKSIPTYAVPVDRTGAPSETVIGSVQTYRIREGDTFLDIARYYDLGYNEIVDANPGVDPWIPEPGTEITLPTQWILPCCAYEGIVVNVPEMRLYQYRRAEGPPGTITVRTYPVGLGREDWRTPRRSFRVRGKTVNPQWNIPESIRREHIRERGDHRRAIAGGHPDNPLGKYRIELANSLYSIHGTNIAWGVGMPVSHGCIRLYPEDIERLFPEVAVGSRVEFIYQPVKVGRHEGATYVEVHSDVYRFVGSLSSAARTELARRKLSAGVDRSVLRSATDDAHGVPVRISALTAKADPIFEQVPPDLATTPRGRAGHERAVRLIRSRQREVDVSGELRSGKG